MFEFAFSAAARGVEAESAVFSNTLVWTQQSEKFEIGVQSLIWWPSLYLEMAEICVYTEIKTIGTADKKLDHKPRGDLWSTKNRKLKL